MTHIYKTNITITGVDGVRTEQIELRNPSASTRFARILTIQVNSDQADCDWVFRRYSGQPTHGTGGDTPTQEAVFKHDSSGLTPLVEVWTGTPTTQIDWSTAGSVTYEHTESLFPIDSGDDKEVVFVKYFPAAFSPVVRPGESMSLEVPDGAIEYLVTIMWESVLDVPVEHIASAALPGSGAYTTASYFDIPDDWTALTFLVTYTAAGGSTNARPKTRVSWSDGTNAYIQPIVETSLDVSAAPVARRSQYELEQRWPTSVTATSTVRFAVPIERMPGLGKVRLDVAELGDTANPGTVVVSIMGGAS